MRRFISLLLALTLCLTHISMLVPTVYAVDTTNAAISVEESYARAGGTVSLDISIKNNPGILGMTLKVTYDESKATLVSVDGGEALNYATFTKPNDLTSGCQLPWDAEDISDVEISDGVIATLTFKVAETAQENEIIDVCVSYDNGAIIDNDMNALSISIQNGYIKVISYTPGDANDDGTVNTTDVVYLRRYVAGGYGISINEAAADVNDDGLINTTDAVYIRRYVAGGYGVELHPSTHRCSHTMEYTPYKAAKCAEDGNISYYHCTSCGKYFADANGTTEISYATTVLAQTGHTAVTDPYVAPTYASTGLTEGSHCSVCGEVLVAQKTIDVLSKEEYVINYVLPSNDDYLTGLYNSGKIVNSNPSKYTSQDGVKILADLNVAGYEFYGWYTEKNGGGTRYSKIPVGMSGELTLYAYMEPIEYDITYNLYQTPVQPITEDKYLKYTVNKGNFNLPNPEVYNYIFLGWYTEDGVEVTQIPVGTTGDITLYAYWTSNRNQAISATSLGDPIVIEETDNNRIYFLYEIGRIVNIPVSDAIWTIQSVYGLSQQQSKTVTTSTSSTVAKEIAETVSKATVDSATWTLSEDWNDVTSVTEEWAQQNGMTVEEANEQAKSSSGTYSLTDSHGGSDTTTSTEGTTALTYNSQNNTNGESSKLDVKISAEISNTESLSKKLVGGFSVSGEIGTENKYNKETNNHTGTDTTTYDTTVSANQSTWNSSTTSSTTQAASESQSVKEAISSIVSDTKGYGSSYSTGGASSNSQGYSSTDSNSVSTASTVSYSTAETVTTTSTYSTDGKSEGYYRLVVAGTAHVFAVVGYDIATESYFTYTYTVMDDKTYEFLDYSSISTFDDYENSVLPFEIPIDVYDYVVESTVYTDGIQFKTDSAAGTAKIVGYTGTSTAVVIPAYVSIGGKSYKVTEIGANAFANSQIEVIDLGKYIKEIPASAFKNCTSLRQVSGYFTVIGDDAFSGCASLENFNISSATTYVGTNAFKNASSIKATVMTAGMIDQVINSGARNITLDISHISSEANLTIEVGTIESFTLDGGGKTYKNLQIISDATATVLNELTITDSNRTPLVISSDYMTLNTVHITTQGYALLLSSDSPTIYLCKDSKITSNTGTAIVCKTPVFIDVTTGAGVGTLDVYGCMYVCGTEEEVEALGQLLRLNVVTGGIVRLTDEEFANYIQGTYTLIFDVNGGTVSTASKIAYCGVAVGELPSPTREGFTFAGWFTDGNVEVTSESFYTASNSMTIHAHWNAMAYTATWDAGWGYTVAVNRTSSPYAGASTGVLSSGATVYHGDVLSVTYVAKTGFTLVDKGATSITVSGNVTSSNIYAKAYANWYTASWSTGTGYTITVNRTSSPYAGSSTGTLSSGAKVYYGDVLSITYTANTGYTLSSSGSTNITVTGDVTSSNIYATATPNSYTYNVVYKSSNGTALGTSTATYNYGTSNTISPKSFTGYNTPSSQTVAWDSTSAKTITFTYTPTSVASTTKSGNIYEDLSYVAVVEYQNRTATSVQIRVNWTATLAAEKFNEMSQFFRATIGSVSTGNVKIASYLTWPRTVTSSVPRSASASSGWITVPLSTTGPTSVDMSVYYYQGNYDGDDQSYRGFANLSTTWSIAIPAY